MNRQLRYSLSTTADVSVWANERAEYAYSSAVSFQNPAFELLMSGICFSSI
jgi:hypothetical protein